MVALAAAGWALVGLPLLLIGATYAVLPPSSRPALGITALAVAAMATGLTLVYPDDGFADLRMSKPELALLYPGVLTALGTLLLSRAIPDSGPSGATRRGRTASSGRGRTARNGHGPTARNGRGRTDTDGRRTRSASRYDRIGVTGRLRLVVIAVLQLPALVLAVICATMIM